MQALVTINKMKNLVAENLRFPEQCQSSQGQSDPKPRLKGVGDGKQVKIPVPGVNRLTVRSDAGVKDQPPVGLGGLSVQAERVGKSALS